MNTQGCPFRCGYETDDVAALIRHGRDECPRRPRTPHVSVGDDEEDQYLSNLAEHRDAKDWYQ